MKVPGSSEKSRLNKSVLNTLKKHRVTHEDNSRVLELFLCGLDSPRSLAVWLLFKNNEHDQLVNLECNPLDYATPSDFRAAYCATKVLSKAEFLDLSVDKHQVSLQKFFDFEDVCRATNKRFRNLAIDPLYKGANVWLLNATERKIHSILGHLNVMEIADKANWGPGVTNSLKKELATGVNKFQSEIGITRDLYSHIKQTPNEKIVLDSVYPLWSGHLHESGFPNYEVGNVIVTVPKDAKSERVICVEPGLNLWFQQGIRHAMESRLRASGVDLRYQSRNQQLAKIAVKARLATVDFSSASDCISSRLVEELLPQDWFEWMNASRSHYGIMGDSRIKWEKFSSMGNAFTFPLETLIFYSAAVAVVEYLGLKDQVKNVSVYGDDVILPQSAFELYSSFSDFLGFRVNRQKSFFSGNFRESCGHHYYDGVDVKPIFLKDLLSTPLSVYRFANQVRIISHRFMNLMACDRKFLPCFALLTRLVPKSLRFKIPLGENPEVRKGDGGFVSNFDEACPSVARHKIKTLTFEGFTVPHVTETAVKSSSWEVGMLLYRLRNSSTQEDSNNFPLRGRTRLRVSLLLVHQWYDLGPWL